MVKHLILTRRKRQEILIDVPDASRGSGYRRVIVDVSEIRDGSVRLGVYAEPDIRIARGELVPVAQE